MHIHVHLQHYSHEPKCESNLSPSMEEGINKMWYIHVMAIVKRKEILTYATTCMNLEQIMLSEISQAKKTSAAWFHLCKVLSIVKLLESELEWWLLDTGEEKRSYCLMGILFQFYKIWRVLKMNGSKGNQQLDECI